jgi:hypothetical protein
MPLCPHGHRRVIVEGQLDLRQHQKQKRWSFLTKIQNTIGEKRVNASKGQGNDKSELLPCWRQLQISRCLHGHRRSARCRPRRRRGAVGPAPATTHEGFDDKEMDAVVWEIIGVVQLGQIHVDEYYTGETKSGPSRSDPPPSSSSGKKMRMHCD